MSVYQFLSQLFVNLNEKKITYCILRNYEDLPDKVENDLDIWVKESDSKWFYEIVRNLSEKLDYTLDYTPRLTLIGEGDYFSIKESDNFINTIHIDCWTYIQWKGLPYIDQSVMEKHLQWYEKGFYILSPGVMAAIMLLKDLLQHGRVKGKYKDSIREYSTKDARAFFESFCSYFGNRYSRFILEMAQSANWLALEKRVNTLRTILFLRRFSHPYSQSKRWFNYFHAQFIRFFINPRGLFIVFIGPDGSGKSTTSSNLMNSEIKRLFQKKLYFHGHFPYLPELKKVVSFFHKNSNVALTLDKNSAPFAKSYGLLRAMIYPLYYGFNYFLGYFFIWKEKARSNLIIFDRYFYDYFIQNNYKNCPRWLLYLITKIIPKPDILIYLKNNPEIIYDRKPELSIEEIERQGKICEELTKHFKNSIIVGTSSSPEEVVRDIQRIVIHKIKERHKIPAVS